MGHMRELIQGWDSREALVFRTDEKQEGAQGSSDYFLDSSNRTHFFMEADAEAEGGGIKEGLSKEESLNKVGHGIHISSDVYRKYCFSDKMRNLVKSLGWKSPVVPQSMYIFKQANIGGTVTSHQDSTFLHTVPKQSCLGLWLALQPATVENGCLWVRPQSHREPLRRVFMRNPEHFDAGDKSKPQMIFKTEAIGNG